MSATAQFSAFVQARAVHVGYNLSSPRSGGRKKLADDTGISHASVCRMLNGQTIPAAESFERLANALDVYVGVLFELAGIVSPGALTLGAAVDLKPLTARQAAARLGIRDPLRVALLETITATLLAEDGAA